MLDDRRKPRTKTAETFDRLLSARMARAVIVVTGALALPVAGYIVTKIENQTAAINRLTLVTEPKLDALAKNFDELKNTVTKHEIDIELLKQRDRLRK